MTLLSRPGPQPSPRSELHRELARRLRFELVPMNTLDGAVASLPAQASVSVTCSPVKGMDVTMDVVEGLARQGHRPVPHFAARMIESVDHLDALVGRTRAAEIDEIFVVAGDADVSAGPFADAIELVAALAERRSGIRHVGFTAYPDGHPFIPKTDLHRALHQKAELLTANGLEGHVSTQMCFSPDTIRAWLKAERQEGFELPVHLGLAGVVDRAKLMSMGARLGVGASLRYLRKNRSAVTKLLAPGTYEPTQLLDPLSGDLDQLRIEGLHVFTFNQVAATEAWRQDVLDR